MFKLFKNVTDTRWAGSHRKVALWQLYAQPAIALMWIITITQFIFSRTEQTRWEKNGKPGDLNVGYYWNADPGSNAFWVIVQLLPMIMDLIFLLCTLIPYSRNSLHPGGLVAVAIFNFGNMAWAAIVGFAIAVICGENACDAAWDGLSYTRVATSAALCLYYAGQIAASSVVVHRMRRERRSRPQAGAEEYAELEGQRLKASAA